MHDSFDPTPDATRDRARASQRCSNCGDPVPAEDWHPVATVRDDDGDVEIYLFCTEACRSAWAGDCEGERA